ncbi:MAG: Ig-like domain-containing protein [Bdellovibrionota bacterium]
MSKKSKVILRFMCLSLVLFFYQNCAEPFEANFTDQFSSGQSVLPDTKSRDIFAKTLQPTLRTNCASCHSAAQSPMFAVVDPSEAFAAIQQYNLVDLNNPALSKFVQKISGGHNGFGTTMAATIQQNIQDWSDELGDIEKPIADLNQPLAGATVTGTINLVSTVSDNVAVTRLQYYVDNKLFGTELTTSPYSLPLNTLTLANGSHTIGVRAFDAAGNFGDDAVVINVSNAPAPDTQVPVVNVTSPVGGAVLVGTVNLTANALDNVAVAYVQFYVDGVISGAQDTTAPYSVSLNTSSLTNAAHIITARAYDAAGNMATSANVNVTVNNPVADTIAPTVSLTAPAAAANLTGTVNVTANAADNVAVVRVQFYLDGAALGAPDTTAPYAVSLDTTTLTNASHVFAARAFDAAGNMTNSTNVTATVNNVVANPMAKFSYISANILGPKCTSCHGAAVAYSNIRYNTYVETMKTVSAGNAGSSKLYQSTGAGGNMPLGGAKLSATEYEAIRAWIAAGALNN